MTSPPYVLVRKAEAEADSRLLEDENPSRKIFAIKRRSDRSDPLNSRIWHPPAKGESSKILETGSGGLEVGIFNQKSKQSCHEHKEATEIYQVLEGDMQIVVDGDTIELYEGDEIIVLPGTCHKVKKDGKFLAKVHTINCYGEEDRYPCNKA